MFRELIEAFSRIIKSLCYTGSERMVDLFDIVDCLVGIIAPAVLVLVGRWCWDRVVRSRTFRATCSPPAAQMPDRDAGHHYSETRKSTVKEPPVFTGAAPDFRQWVFSIELAMRALSSVLPRIWLLMRQASWLAMPNYGSCLPWTLVKSFMTGRH